MKISFFSRNKTHLCAQRFKLHGTEILYAVSCTEIIYAAEAALQQRHASVSSQPNDTALDFKYIY